MKRSEAKEVRRRAILNAALFEFSGRRFDEVKLEDVATRAGVGKGTLYLYFKNKEDLFLQMAIDGVAEMTACIRALTLAPEPFRDRFFLLGRRIAEFVRIRSVMFRLMDQMFSPAIRKEFISHHRNLMQAARAFLQKGMDEGVLRKDRTAAELHCFLIGPLLFRARLNEYSGEEIETDPLLELFWRAVSA